MGAGTEDAIGLEPARRGGTAGSGTNPGPNCVYMYIYLTAYRACPQPCPRPSGRLESGVGGI